AEHAPEDAADQHAAHLHVEQQHAGAEQILLRDADAAQARDADDAEEDQVVDVDEVAERGHEDRHGDGPRSVVLGRESGVAVRRCRAGAVPHLSHFRSSGTRPLARTGGAAVLDQRGEPWDATISTASTAPTWCTASARRPSPSATARCAW